MAGRFTCAVAALLLLGDIRPAAAEAIDVPSDPRAKYQALTVTKRPGSLVEILSRRDGPSGTSFALREIDCARQLARYIGEGDTLDQAQAPRTANSALAPMFAGSITWHVAQFACRAR